MSFSSINPIIIVIGIALLLLIIQSIRSSIAKASLKSKLRKAEDKSKEMLAQATEIRDESYVKLNDENRNLKKEIEELKNVIFNLKSNMNALNNAEKDKKELYIYNLALEKMKNDPKTNIIFNSFWPTYYNEAIQEYEDASIGKKIFNFITLKHLRSTNKRIEVKDVEVIEDKTK